MTTSAQPALTEQSALIDGVTIHYATGPLAEPGTPGVLLLHGWGGSIQSWTPVTADLLARGRRVLVLDFPGFGKSSLPPFPWGVEDYTRNLIALIEQLGFCPCSVVAHSFGGRVALVLAATRPDLVRRLVLTAGAGIRTDAPSSLRNWQPAQAKPSSSYRGCRACVNKLFARLPRRTTSKRGHCGNLYQGGVAGLTRLRGPYYRADLAHLG
ncbi:MAG: alpha/beta fold hydrolase [Chloroflexaceae bacterium]|nr:alpha/beta fold hydrolase [Chloroflexaceae bacterium]